jgi:DNA-binding YbaB/EbfC family protein
MKDLGELMKQAQAMQEKMAEAQLRLASLEVEGIAGAGMVRLSLKGMGDMTRLVIDPALMAPGEGDILADLIRAAHADARRKLDTKQQDMLRDAAGPLAGLNLPGMPKF